YTNDSKKPTWTDVIETIYTLAQDEEQKMGLASYRKSATSNAATSSGTNSAPANPAKKKDRPTCPHCGKGHTAAKCWTAHPDLIPADHVHRDNLLARAAKHICNKDCKETSTNSNGNGNGSSVFVKGASGVIGGSSVGGLALKKSAMMLNKAIYTAVDNDAITSSDIVVDSGCSNPVFNDLTFFTSYTVRDDLQPFTAANGEEVKPLGSGTVFFQVEDPNDSSRTIDWTIEDVEYSPLSPANLLSPGKLRKSHIEYDYATTSLIDTQSRKGLAKVRWISDVCIVNTVNGTTIPVDTALGLASVKTKSRPTLDLMHRRLIHAHPSRVVEACRRVGIRFTQDEIDSFHCEACHLAKSTEIISRDAPLPLTL
ncbi:hypothetical protein LY78DRAFT_675490, partial [Colletotrichum sublineola]